MCKNRLNHTAKNVDGQTGSPARAMGASETACCRGRAVQRETNVRGSEHQSPARELPQLAKRPFVQRVLWWPQKEKLRRQQRQSQWQRRRQRRRCNDGKPAKRWPNALAIVAVVVVAAPVWLTDLTLQGSVASDASQTLQALRNYSWVHNLISNWPTGATQLPATVATRRQQAACNTIR